MNRFFLTILTFVSIILSGCDNDKNAINVASFNIWCASNPNANNWQGRKDEVVDLIKDENFEIFGTQEGLLHQLNYIAEKTGFKYIGSGRENGKNSGEFAAIFYNPERFKLLKNGDFWFAETPEKPVMGWDAACKRICSWGEFLDKKSGKKFYFFSLHFDHRGKIARVESAKLICKKVAEIAKNSPFFCVGDFNAQVDSEPMKIIFGNPLFQDSKNASITQPQGPSCTWHGNNGTSKYDRIDYIFSSKGTKVLSHKVCDNKSKNQSKSKYPSDHFPVFARILLK